MLKLPLNTIKSKQVAVKAFQQKHSPFLVVAVAFIVAILAIASFITPMPLAKTLLLIGASIVLLFAYLGKYRTKSHLYNLSTVKEAFVVAFVIAGFAVIASSVVYLIASIVLFIGAIVLLGSLMFIVIFVAALLASVTFFLPLLMYIAVLSLVIYLLIWFFKSKPTNVASEAENIELNTDKLKKNLKDNYLGKG